MTLTMLAAYGSFLIAEKFHVSGVLATLAAGMLVGNWRRGERLTEVSIRRVPPCSGLGMDRGRPYSRT